MNLEPKVAVYHAAHARTVAVDVRDAAGEGRRPGRGVARAEQRYDDWPPQLLDDDAEGKGHWPRKRPGRRSWAGRCAGRSEPEVCAAEDQLCR